MLNSVNVAEQHRCILGNARVKSHRHTKKMALEVDYLKNCSFHLKDQTHTVQLEETDSQTNDCNELVLFRKSKTCYTTSAV